MYDKTFLYSLQYIEILNDNTFEAFFLRKKVADSKKSSTFATAFEGRNVDC